MTHSRHTPRGIKEARLPPGENRSIARNEFLIALRKQAPHALEDLRDKVLPQCKETPDGAAPDEVLKWAQRHNLDTPWLRAWAERALTRWEADPHSATKLYVPLANASGWVPGSEFAFIAPAWDPAAAPAWSWSAYEAAAIERFRAELARYKEAQIAAAEAAGYEAVTLKRKSKGDIGPVDRAGWLVRYQVRQEGWAEIAGTTGMYESQAGKIAGGLEPERIRVSATSLAKQIELPLRK